MHEEARNDEVVIDIHTFPFNDILPIIFSFIKDPRDIVKFLRFKKSLLNSKTEILQPSLYVCEFNSSKNFTFKNFIHDEIIKRLAKKEYEFIFKNIIHIDIERQIVAKPRNLKLQLAILFLLSPACYIIAFLCFASFLVTLTCVALRDYEYPEFAWLKKPEAWIPAIFLQFGGVLGASVSCVVGIVCCCLTLRAALDIDFDRLERDAENAQALAPRNKSYYSVNVGQLFHYSRKVWQTDLKNVTTSLENQGYQLRYSTLRKI